MKAYLFIPCGERTIKKGEYYREACTGKRYTFFRAEEDMRLNGFEVVEPYEMEIPDGTEKLSINVSIPRPRKKVKKWRWAIKKDNGINWTTDNHHSEEEMEEYTNWEGCTRLWKTEVEE